MSLITSEGSCEEFNYLTKQFQSIKEEKKIRKKIDDQYTQIMKKCLLAASRGKYCCTFNGYIPSEIEERLKKKGFGIGEPDSKDFYTGVFWYDWQVEKKTHKK